LQAAASRLVFSFCDFYGKGQGRLRKTLQGSGIRLADSTVPGHAEALERIARGFREIAACHGLEIFSCSEAVDLAAAGIEHGACIDSALIGKLFGVAVSVGKDGNQRDACRCAAAADMGSYNSCPFRCAYCYANFNERMIENNRCRHFPDSPALLGRYEEPVEIRTSLHKKKKSACPQTSFA